MLKTRFAMSNVFLVLHNLFRHFSHESYFQQIPRHFLQPANYILLTACRHVEMTSSFCSQATQCHWA